MPNAQQHFQQYQHNKELLTNHFINSDKYQDWFITITFYCLVHIVEKKFAELSIPQHFTRHMERNAFILLCKDFKKIAPKYQTIYNQSIRARYKCVKITNSDVSKVRQLFEEIEKELSA